MKKQILIDVINILRNDIEPSTLDIIKIVDNSDINLIRRLKEIFIGLRMQNGVYKINDIEEAVILAQYDKFSLEIKFSLSEVSGLINKMFLEPRVPNIKEYSDLEKIFSDVSDYHSIIIKDKTHKTFKVNGSTPLAVASLIKLAVAGSTYLSIKNGYLDLDSYYIILEKDISTLSVGISKKDIGNSISIRELLSRLLLASDNTAMDVLIRVVGGEAIQEFGKKILGKNDFHIDLTKDIISRAWGHKKDTEKDLRNRVLADVSWIKKIDYFICLDDIYKCLEYISYQNWTPWDDLDNQNIIYKGGSSTGILSAIWARKSKKKIEEVCAFTVNNRKPLTLPEELFLYECTRKCLKENRLLQVSEKEKYDE